MDPSFADLYRGDKGNLVFKYRWTNPTNRMTVVAIDINPTFVQESIAVEMPLTKVIISNKKYLEKFA
jgi:hypothetical protein